MEKTDPSGHPSPRELRDFNCGRLDEPTALALSEHLEGSPDCCQALADLTAQDPFVAWLRDPADGGPGPGVPLTLVDYRIVREIGRGGMGVVYVAEQISLRRRVALKVLPARKLGDEVALARFRRESRVTARLHHTNIVPVYEVGEEGDYCFYAMQLIAGRSLTHIVCRLRRRNTEDR